VKKYFIGLLIVVAAGVALLLFFSQGLFTASDGVVEPADDAVKVGDDTLEPVEEEVEVDAPDEEAAGEESEPAGGEGDIAADDVGFTITETPHQDFIRARLKGEPIVLKFYSGT
jgi:hypothetical protein